MVWPLRPSSAISPTAHYTGYTWLRAGLSDEALATTTGRVLYESLRLPMAAAARLGLPTLEGMLVGRHLVIDSMLDAAIDAGRVTQVIELACGLSPRGLTFSRRYGDRLTYIEADLAAMAATKAKLLESIGPLNDHHRVVEVDAFRDEGPTSLAALAGALPRDQGLAVITEGLVNYFPAAAVTSLWERIAGLLQTFVHGLYLSDIVLGGSRRNPLTVVGQGALSLFVQGQVFVHFAGPVEARDAVRRAGFAEATVTRADQHPAAARLRRDRGARLAHVIEAVTT